MATNFGSARSITAKLRPGAIFLLLAMGAPAAGQTVEVLGTDPPAGSVLNVGEVLYVHLGYAGDQPLRFQARGFRNGSKRSKGLRTNPAPTYPAGSGEAVVWLEYIDPEAIDELRIEVTDRNWKLLTESVLPFDMEWQPGSRSPLRTRAAWVKPLSDAQQQMTSMALANAHSDDDGFWGLLIMLAGWSIPGYFALQIIFYRRWHDGWRKAALLPLWGTIPILAYTLFALFAGSNLWPLVMLFTLPLAFLYLVALACAKRVFAAG
jgi:hypothetical protein